MEYKTIISRYYYEDGHLYYKDNISARARRGQRVGYKGRRGYVVTKYNGMRLQVHRLIYCYFNECDYGDIIGWEIDHLDNNPSNNKIENLILCEHWENQHNRSDTKLNGYSYSYYHKNGLPIPDEVRQRINEVNLRRYYLKKDKE